MNFWKYVNEQGSIVREELMTKLDSVRADMKNLVIVSGRKFR